jgi:hypothetical protein
VDGSCTEYSGGCSREYSDPGDALFRSHTGVVLLLDTRDVTEQTLLKQALSVNRTVLVSMHCAR